MSTPIEDVPARTYPPWSAPKDIEKLLHVLEQELSVFDRGDHPNYEVIVEVFDYFLEYPDSCHHPKENMIFDKLKSRDPATAAKIGDLRIGHEEEASRLRRAAQAVEQVLDDRFHEPDHGTGDLLVDSSFAVR
jgi:hemerythrin-like domain-containing protein